MKKNSDKVKLSVGLPPIGSPDDDTCTDWNEWFLQVENLDDCEKFDKWGNELNIGFVTCELKKWDDGENTCRLYVGDMEENPQLVPMSAKLVEKFYREFVLAA